MLTGLFYSIAWAGVIALIIDYAFAMDEAK